MSVAQALVDVASGDIAAARSACQEAASTSVLATHLLRHLANGAPQDVYTDPEAFDRFISGGSNVNLYAATEDQLRAHNQVKQPRSILDIGCGDGRVTAATLPASCEAVHLLEPSEALLAEATRSLLSNAGGCQSHETANTQGRRSRHYRES